MKVTVSGLLRTLSVLMLTLWTFGFQAGAQSVKANGVVVDVNGEPLVGAGVLVKGTTIGTITDTDGSFSLSVNPGTTVQISSIGYVTRDVVVNGSNKLTIILEEDKESLDEVVVVGYGTQKKASLTSAISSVSSKDLVTTTANTTAGSLVGKVAGLTFRQSDGQPGSYASIEIRNMSTPLYIIDGVAVEIGQFNNIDANDIESITVLKDASAAIYGLRASNGVILVTTKMGKANERNTIKANFTYGFQNFFRYPDLANAAEFYEGRMQADLNTNGYTARTNEELALWKEGKGEYESFDWKNFILQKNAPQKYGTVSMSGGSDKISYYFSVSQTDQDAMVSSNNFKRTNIQSNTEARVSDRFKLGMRISGRIEERHTAATPVSGWFDDYWQSLYAMFQNWPTQRPYANDNPDYVNNTRNAAVGAAIFDEDLTGYNDNIWKSLTANTYAEYEIAKGLRARAAYTYWIAQQDLERFRKAFYVYDYDEATDTYKQSWGSQSRSRTRTKTQRQEHTFQAQLSYENNFGGSHVTGLLGMEALQRMEEGNTLKLVPTNNYIELTNNLDEMTSISNSYSHTRRVGYIMRATYDWQSRYLVEFSGRYDGSYLYGDGMRWGLFPSVSGGWRISEEPFMEGVKNAVRLSNLKLRASWGETGNEEGVSAFGYLAGYTYGSGSAVIDGDTVTGVQYKGMPVTNLTWTHVKTTDIGLDYGFFEDRLSGSFDIFSRIRTGRPAKRYDVLIPSEVGLSLPNENLSTDYHVGYEGSASWHDRIGDFSYNIGANFTVARYMVGESYKPRFGSSWDYYRNSSEMRWGGQTWGYTVIGRFEDYEDIQNYAIDNDGQGNTTMLPGDFKFKDWNEDGKITSLDQRILGYSPSWNPVISGGLLFNMSYKGFDLMTNFSFATAQSYALRWEGAYPFQGDGNSTRYLITDCWHRSDPTDPNSEWIAGTFPATRYAGNNVSFTYYSDFWFKNVTYLKLRTLEFGYTLPKKFTQKFFCENLRVYFNGYNLFSLDNLAQFQLDPEITLDSALTTPNPRTLTLGVDLTF